jgi:molybdopterin synthase catalytic subunit
MVEQWLEEAKKRTDPGVLGMVLVHNGIVRGTPKDGKLVRGMKLYYDEGAVLGGMDNCRRGSHDLSPLAVHTSEA